MTIYFYTKNDEHGYCSNFANFGIEVAGIYWPTVEHYFQAQKFSDPELQAKIFRAKTPKQALSLGQTRTVPIRQDWESVKDEIMYFSVKLKFVIHTKIRNRLLSTHPEELVESSPYDYYWGSGQDGSGQNKLGIILMKIREEFIITPP